MKGSLNSIEAPTTPGYDEVLSINITSRKSLLSSPPPHSVSRHTRECQHLHALGIKSLVWLCLSCEPKYPRRALPLPPSLSQSSEGRSHTLSLVVVIKQSAVVVIFIILRILERWWSRQRKFMDHLPEVVLHVGALCPSLFPWNDGKAQRALIS